MTSIQAAEQAEKEARTEARMLRNWAPIIGTIASLAGAAATGTFGLAAAAGLAGGLLTSYTLSAAMKRKANRIQVGRKAAAAMGQIDEMVAAEIGRQSGRGARGEGRRPGEPKAKAADPEIPRQALQTNP